MARLIDMFDRDWRLHTFNFDVTSIQSDIWHELQLIRIRMVLTLLKKKDFFCIPINENVKAKFA